jgi:prepilin-type N-terminal cleavage/methylation domain-containing protein
LGDKGVARQHPRYRSSIGGFTIVELMTVIAVLAVLTVVAVPGLRSLSANNQVAATKSAFVAALSLARAEAARQGQVVVFEPQASGTTGNEYAKGWRVRLDDPAHTVLRTYEALPDAVRIGTEAGSDTPATFATTGYLNPAAQHRYRVCPADLGSSTAGYALTLTPSGTVDVESLTCTS